MRRGDGSDCWRSSCIGACGPDYCEEAGVLFSSLHDLCSIPRCPTLANVPPTLSLSLITPCSLVTRMTVHCMMWYTVAYLYLLPLRLFSLSITLSHQSAPSRTATPSRKVLRCNLQAEGTISRTSIQVPCSSLSIISAQWMFKPQHYRKHNKSKVR